MENLEKKEKSISLIQEEEEKEDIPDDFKAEELKQQDLPEENDQGLEQNSKLNNLKEININNNTSNLNTPSDKDDLPIRQAPMRKGASLWRFVQNKTSEITKNSKGLENYLGVELNKQVTTREEVVQDKFLVIMPDSAFRIGWNMITAVYLIYISTYFTFRVCFQGEDDNEFLDVFDRVMHNFFIVDLFINFFSAFYDDENQLVLNNKYIAMNYIKGWFLIDLLAVLPLGEMFTYGTFTFRKSHRYNILLKLLRISQMYRLAKIPRLLKRLETVFFADILNWFNSLSSSQKRVIKIMIFSTLLIHVSSSLYYLIGISTSPNWLDKEDVPRRSKIELYFMSIEWSLQTLTTVGFGDMYPMNAYEYIFTVFWMIIGGAFYSLMVSNLHSASQSEEMDKSLSHQLNKILVLQKELDLPLKTTLQIKKQISMSYKQFQEHHLIRNLPFIEQLPYNLKSPLLICVYSSILNSTPFFLGKHINLIRTYLPKLEPLKLKRMQKLYNQDEEPEYVFFVTSGVVDLVDKFERRKCTFVQGDMFGEVETMCNITRVCSCVVRSVEANFFLLRKADFIQMLLDFPQIQIQVKQLFEKKIDLMKTYFSKEDLIIAKVPFDTIIKSYRKYTLKDNKQENLNLADAAEEDVTQSEDAVIQCNGYQYDQSDPLTHIEASEKELQNFPHILFSSQNELDKFVSSLSQKYQKEFFQKTEEYLSITSKTKKMLQDKIDYYKQKADYMDYLLKKVNEVKLKRPPTRHHN